VRTPTTLETRDELQEDAVDAIADVVLVPLHLARMLLALVQQQGLHHIGRDGIAREIEVSVAECLENAQAALPIATFGK
jgi:hypothetical protein